jgi:hypothetical protein
VVVPFPLTKRPGFARKHAAAMARLRPEKAAEYLDRQLTIQRDVLAKRGVDQARIDAEISALACQIRLETRNAFQRPGEAG